MLKDAERDGIILDNSQRSLNWLRLHYNNLRPSDVTERVFIRETDRRRRVPIPGMLYMFLYKPKGMHELPYYDRFPLVFPFRRIRGGFIGLNMHYLPPIYRARLMDALYDTISDTELDEDTRLRITYKILDASTKYRWFRPCVKRYLSSYMQSSLLFIHPMEWNLALFVPSEQFKKKKKQVVWAESKKQISGL